ncbi:DUF456 domain-containing protein [Desulfonatronum thioautotrophicum]|uniref:DUF456 domain-containing protein n=1 Tax=Desulfonatronum thioautotrophicum TaxID=617001 RepID=UPI0005EBC8B0|nr:DUF456 domain-containing protein [Desulfonatronum thioautotrophicum]
MSFVLAGFFLGFLGLLLTLHVFGLPANWLILAAMAAWGWLNPDFAGGLGFFAILFALCVLGEVVEFAAQVYGGRRYGGSRKGAWAAVIGAIIGGVLGAPFFFGLGAVPGSFLGAYLGSLLIELGQGYPPAAARRAAWGAMWNKVFGTVVKICVGVWMIVLSFDMVWPG